MWISVLHMTQQNDNFHSYATAAAAVLLSIVRTCLRENYLSNDTNNSNLTVSNWSTNIRAAAICDLDFNPVTLKLIIQIKSHCISNSYL